MVLVVLPPGEPGERGELSVNCTGVDVFAAAPMPFTYTEDGKLCCLVGLRIVLIECLFMRVWNHYLTSLCLCVCRVLR